MSYKWQYCSLGGVARVRVSSGKDLAHLDELDEKYWTVLSCPVDGLDMDAQTLKYLDSDGDGKIRVHEVKAAAKWLCEAVRDTEMLLRGDSAIELDAFNATPVKSGGEKAQTKNAGKTVTEKSGVEGTLVGNGKSKELEGSELGKSLRRSAEQILEYLGKSDRQQLTLEDVSDPVAIFKGTRFNGDGVITLISAGDDASLKETIADCMKTVGTVADRSGESGVTAEMIDAFYAHCNDYAQWMAAAPAAMNDSQPQSATADATEGTAEVHAQRLAEIAAAWAACCALKGKVADFFMRCKLLNYNEAAAVALELKPEAEEDLAACPLAKPTPDGVLSLKAVNPAWEGAVKALLQHVAPAQLADSRQHDIGSEGSADKGSTDIRITEQSWNAFCARFEPYAAWQAAKKGAEVEVLGIDRVRTVIAENRRQDLQDLLAADLSKKAEADSIDLVRKFMYLYRDFYKLLHNYVIFSDFYNRDSGKGRAAFEAGKLYIDQRCCDLCIRVTDMAGHNDMAKLSGMFLLYCRCTSKIRPETLDIVAVLTAGDTGDLRPGKNGVFYDLQGRDWDATITKVVDNPISIANAFWAPYRKFWNFCVGLISKSAEEKDSKVMKDMQDKAAKSMEARKNAQPAADGASPEGAAGKPAAFDIAKFAGIFAAIGLALGYIGSFVSQIIAGISAAAWWQLLIAVAAIMIIISGPSCFLAWGKLRRRNLGPVLNANGWAINSKVLVNIVFGNRLTSMARYPKVRMADPYAKRRNGWKWFLAILVLSAAGVAAYWHFCLRPADTDEGIAPVAEEEIVIPDSAKVTD